MSLDDQAANRARRSRALWRLAGPLGLMAAIFVLSSRPLPVDIEGGGDKVAHFAAFALLAGLWVFALSPHASAGRTALLAFVASTLYGLVDELHQAFVPARNASFGDLLADMAGAGSVAALWWAFARLRAGAGASEARGELEGEEPCA